MVPVEDTHENDEDGDLCRICRSPEGPENPLRYPCACRGSIKYVHQECLLLWLNRRGYKQCEVCKRSYSFVPVYAENAPERLPRSEFLKGLLVRALRFFAWVTVILFNAYCFALHPWGQKVATENQNVFRVNWMFASLMASFLYNGFIAHIVTIVTLLRITVERVLEAHRRIIGENEIGRVIGENEIGNNHIRGHGVVAGCVIVLWKYMSILSDWWHDQLIRTQIFHVIMDEPLEALIRPRNAQLHEFGVIRRFFSLLDDNVFAVLAISTYVSFFFILLPFSMGKLVFGLLHLLPRIEKLPTDELGQEMVKASFVFSSSPVVSGYKLMLFFSFAYVGSFVNLRLDTIQAIFRGLSLGFLLIAYLLWILSGKVWRNLSIVKDGFILTLKLGVSPLLLGIWLDLCILPLSGTTISRRLEIVSEYPVVMIIHWMFGCICLTFTFIFMWLMQKIIRKRAFWFLLDVTDPDYKITKLHLGQSLFALAFHGTLMVIAVHLPIKTISFISPSFFPLQFWFYDERLMFVSIAAYVFLAEVIKRLAKLTIPALEPTVHKWVISVSSWLQLNSFLLKNLEDQNMRPLLQEPDDWCLVSSVAEGSVVSFYGAQSDTIEEQDTEEDRFIILRIGLMLVLAILSLFLISTISMALPFLMGRMFFDSISCIIPSFNLKYDDLCGFWIGCYILRVIYISICFIVNHIKMGRTDLLLNFVLLWIRNAILFALWISVIPALLGLLIDLMIIIPSRVALNKSPFYYLLQDWLIGSVVLHIWTFLTMFTRVKCFATLAWREKLEMIRSVGINQLPSAWLFFQVIGSIVGSLLTILGFPFLVAYSLFPLLGFSGAINSAVQRLIWPVLLAMIILGFVAKLTLDLFMYIHRVEYDDQYVVGTRVTNFTEDS